MNSLKQDDIFWSIDVIHDKNSSPKNKKNALFVVFELLQEASHSEILNGNWQQIIDDVCAPVFIRSERTDLRNVASKIVILIGTVLFRKSDFQQFHNSIIKLFANTSKRYEDSRAELLFCFSHIIGATTSHSKDILCEKHAEVCLRWVLDVVPTATSLIYNNCIKTIVLISTVYPKTFESKLEEVMETICMNLDESDKNFDFLIDSLESFQNFFSEKSYIAENLSSQLISRTDKSIRRRLRIVLILMRISKSRNTIVEINEAIRQNFEKPEWSPTILSAFCPIFNEMFVFCKDDKKMMKDIETNIEIILKSAGFSEKSTNNEYCFVEFLSQIVRHLPPESEIKKRIIELVFDEQVGLFNSKSNRMSIFAGRHQFYKETSELISHLLTPKSLSYLQTTFSSIRRIVLESIENLRNAASFDSDTCRWNEATLVILLSSLNSISCAKSSLIVMMGIRPSIFEFFVKELPLTENWLVEKHPAVYHVLIHLLVSHLKAHEFYLSQSEYVQQGDSVGQTKREYAKLQVISIEKILRFDGETMPTKIRLLITSWISAFVTMASGMNLGEEVYRRVEWVKLRTTMSCQSSLTWNSEGIANILSKLSTVMPWIDTDEEKENRIFETTKKSSWKNAAGIWEAADSRTHIRQSVNGMYQVAQETQQKHVQTTTFGADEFTIVTNFLLKSIVPTTFRKGSYNWMDEMLDSMTNLCSVVGEKKKMEVSDKFFEKWRWALNQTANYCIINKMKTPLGKPMETFNAFSLEINKLAKQVLTNRKSSKDSKNEMDGINKSTLRYTVQWCRVRLLIELIDILDKMMCCAMYGGASFNLTEIPALSRQFFTTNVQSCAEWLNRTYYSALVVSFFNGNYALAIRFGWSALLVYQKRARDEKTTGLAVTICCWMCRAMTALSDPQSIVGMRSWMRKEFKTELAQNVLEAMELMAANRYEMALFNFELILRNDQTVGETVKLIIHNCVIDILNRLRNWDNIDYYKDLLYGGEEDVVTEDFKSVELLTKFEKIEGKDKRHILGWNIRQKSMAIESAFSQTMRKVEINDIKRDLSQMGALLLNSDASCRLYSDVSSTNLVVSYLVDKMNGLTPRAELTTHELFDNDDYDEGEKLATINKIVSWSKHLHTSRGISGDCYAELVRLARKTDNRNLAVRMMMLSMKFGVSPWMSLENAKQDFKLTRNENLDIRVQKMTGVFATIANVFMVNCKNKQNLKMERAPAEFYGEFISLNYDERLTFIRRCDESMSRVALQLSEFFNEFHEHEHHLLPHFGQSLLWSEIHQRKMQLGVNYRGFVGALLSISTELCPELAKTHLKFAQWAYQLADVQYVKEMNAVYQHITLHADPKINDSLWKCLECSTLGQLENDIRKLLKHSNEIQNLLSPNGYYLNMWANVKEHRTKYLTISASSYFQFIHASGGPLPYSKKEEITVATLRILDMLVRHGDILIEIIENGLNTTNVNVWREILPQLFARLSHPSEHIRTTLVNLISRICSVSPHSVVFQVVSGASSSSTFTSEEEEIEEIDEQDAHDDDRNKVRDCCEQLENRLAEQYPKLVADVRKFVAELERINLLNEEKWAVVLGTMEHEMEKRIALIRSEFAKTQKATHLTDEQRNKIMKQKTKLMTSQVFDVLDELYDKTCLKPCQTENEKQFQSAFAEQLAAAFVESKLNRTSPEKAWQPFKNLVSSLVHRNLKKGMQTFEIQNISPYLSSLSGSFVPMPGQDSVDFDNVLTISRVAKQVTVLPTKTRPKKLAFVGSDGKSCTFLFKGREDLHLDERVMQFLRLCNIMLTSGRQVAEYQAHNYAVIPLGPRSGLIKWVEGATPLFHIYRKWQVRDKAHRQAMQKNGEAVSDIERPSEMYHKMVRQAFTTYNIDSTIASDRSKWPVEVMNEVHRSLVDKTPNDLLSRELWIRSGCATTWWRVSNRFARSCSVMSMIGSVLGLGDRHLDNLLVDLNHGNIIHIDYNICFDKGRNLRIPETVPFRLTQNMVHALGPAMIDGVFRESCVHVLQKLRNGKQVLTMLLDAFVYDPLVDWTNHESISSGISLALKLAVYGSEWKKKMMHNGEDNALEMFKLRVVELKYEWIKNKEDLQKSIQSYSDSLLLQNETQRVEASRLMLQAVTKHHSLMKCLRPLIRTISKDNHSFVNYYALYKKYFNEPLLKAHGAMPDEKNSADTKKCVHKFSIVLENIDRVFNSLLELTNPPEVQTLKPSATTPPPGLENVWLVKEDQVENAMARQIVKSVERRLDGFVNATGTESLTPAQQADYLISEATSINNLSKMYEGWTAWV